MKNAAAGNRQKLGSPEPALTRTSQALRDILSKNPTLATFTVEQILHSLGHTDPALSLLFFSVPGILPIPGTSNLNGAPMCMIAAQIIAGKRQIRLPEFILTRTVPRRSLAVAIHSVLPVLQKLEKATKPRWRWIQSPMAQRMIGVLIFLSAIAIACPVLGFNMPHATAVFTTALGLLEQDGLAVLLGVLIGIASLICLGPAGLSFRALRSQLRVWVKQTVKRFSLRWVGRVLMNLGLQWLKSKLRWAVLLLLWNPEAPKNPETSRAARASAETSPAEAASKRVTARLPIKPAISAASRPTLRAA